MNESKESEDQSYDRLTIIDLSIDYRQSSFIYLFYHGLVISYVLKNLIDDECINKYTFFSNKLAISSHGGTFW